MRVKVFLSTTVIQGGKSGVGQYVFGLLDGLMEIGASTRIDLTLIGKAADRPLFDKWLHETNWIDAPAICAHPVGDLLWHQTGLRGLLARRDAQILHVPSYRRIVRKPPCRQLATIHDCAPFQLAGKYDAARTFFGRCVVPCLAQQADHIVAVSHSTADDVHKFLGVARASISVVHNGLNHRRFRPLPAGEVARWRKDHAEARDPYFIYVARLEHPAKNHVRLIEAFEKFKKDTGAPHRLLLGGADWHGAQMIHARIAQSPVRDAIQVLGFVAPEELPHWYGGALAMIYPSLFEGFGLPPLEAMACGCPVVASNRGSLAEVCGGAAMLVDPERVDEMASALQRLTTDPELTQVLHNKGLTQAGNFSWKVTASQILALYLSLSGA